VNKRVRSASLYHSRQCGIVLKPRSDHIDYTVDWFMTNKCNLKLWKQQAYEHELSGLTAVLFLSLLCCSFLVGYTGHCERTDAVFMPRCAMCMDSCPSGYVGMLVFCAVFFQCVSSLIRVANFYAESRMLRASLPSSGRLSVCPSVCHTRDLYQNGAS